MANQQIYIGDGVTAEPDGDGGVILRTTRIERIGLFGERECEHWIALDAQTWAALVVWKTIMDGDQCGRSD